MPISYSRHAALDGRPRGAGKAFEEVEQQEMGAGTHERFHALADELCAKWHVPIPQHSTDHSGCSHP